MKGTGGFGQVDAGGLNIAADIAAPDRAPDRLGGGNGHGGGAGIGDVAGFGHQKRRHIHIAGGFQGPPFRILQQAVPGAGFCVDLRQRVLGHGQNPGGPVGDFGGGLQAGDKTAGRNPLALFLVDLAIFLGHGFIVTGQRFIGCIRQAVAQHAIA